MPRPLRTAVCPGVVTLGGSNITFDHNTVVTDGTSVIYADVAAIAGFTFTNNIVPDNLWAIMGSRTLVLRHARP